MNTIDPIVRQNAPALMCEAFAHCIFPLTQAAELAHDGPIIFAEGSGAP